MTPLLGLLLLRFSLTLTFTILGFTIPLGAAIVGIVRKVIVVILEFIPL